MKRLSILLLLILLIPQTGFPESLLGKHGIHARFNFLSPMAGPEYAEVIDSGLGFGVDYLRSLGHNLYLKTGFDYNNVGESADYYYRNGYYYWNDDAFNFHMFGFSLGLRYLYNNVTPMPFFEMSPGIYITSLGGNSWLPDSYKDATAFGLNFGGGVMIPFYGNGLFEVGARYTIDFIPDESLQFLSFTGGFSYYFRR